MTTANTNAAAAPAPAAATATAAAESNKPNGKTLIKVSATRSLKGVKVKMQSEVIESFFKAVSDGTIRTVSSVGGATGERRVYVFSNAVFGEDKNKHPYTGGMYDLYIEWVPVGTKFIVTEYDGSEGMMRMDEVNWETA